MLLPTHGSAHVCTVLDETVASADIPTAFSCVPVSEPLARSLRQQRPNESTAAQLTSMLSSPAGRTRRQPWPSQATEKALLSMGHHRPQAYEQGESDGESTASGSSASSYRRSRRRRKRPATAADTDASSGVSVFCLRNLGLACLITPPWQISPTILFLAILLIAAIGAAVYFAMEARRIPNVRLSSNRIFPDTRN